MELIPPVKGISIASGVMPKKKIVSVLKNCRINIHFLKIPNIEFSASIQGECVLVCVILLLCVVLSV